LLYLRKEKTKKEVSTDSFPILQIDDYSEEKEVKLKKMYECIQKLDETGKMIILMVLEGIDYDKISEVVGISEETLRVRIHRIKKSLTQCIQQ
jgi:RNA polymerase sigma-70 factor (ECF subfamily)